MKLILSLGLNAKISLLRASRVKVNQRSVPFRDVPRKLFGAALALPQGTMGADSRDALGVDVCCAGRNFDLPTSSIRLVSASFNSASGTTKSAGDNFICLR